MAASLKPRPKVATKNEAKIKKLAAITKAKAAIKKNIPRVKPPIEAPDVPTPKRGGRVKGTPNKATVEKANAVSEIMAKAFDGLTDDEIDTIGPFEILMLLLRAAMRGRLANEAKMLSLDLLPYVRARKRDDAPGYDPNAAPVKFTVIGGLPQRYKLELGMTGATITDDDPEEEKPNLG